MEIFVFYKYFEIPSFIGKKGKNVGIWQKEGYNVVFFSCNEDGTDQLT